MKKNCYDKEKWMTVELKLTVEIWRRFSALCEDSGGGEAAIRRHILNEIMKKPPLGVGE